MVAVKMFVGAHGKNRPSVLGSSMAELLQWFVDGDTVPVVGKTYHFSDVNAAFEALGSGKSTGKLVLTP